MTLVPIWLFWLWCPLFKELPSVFGRKSWQSHSWQSGTWEVILSFSSSKFPKLILVVAWNLYCDVELKFINVKIRGLECLIKIEQLKEMNLRERFSYGFQLEQVHRNPLFSVHFLWAQLGITLTWGWISLRTKLWHFLFYANNYTF